MKALALNYFCDSKGRSMVTLCRDFQKAEKYKSLSAFINNDSVLRQVESEMKWGDVQHHSKAIRRINELICNQVDLSYVVMSL